MAITKSNKHKLALDHDKPNEKGGYTLATPYALMRSLILDSQISITPLGSCTPLHSKGVSQLNKWARELKWTSRRSIYTPSFKTWPLLSTSAKYDMTRHTGQFIATVLFTFARASHWSMTGLWPASDRHPPDAFGPDYPFLEPLYYRPNAESPTSGQLLNMCPPCYSVSISALVNNYCTSSGCSYVSAAWAMYWPDSDSASGHTIFPNWS
jgi:hypothetical protein